MCVVVVSQTFIAFSHYIICITTMISYQFIFIIVNLAIIFNCLGLTILSEYKQMGTNDLSFV